MVIDIDLNIIVPESEKIDVENCIICFKEAGANQQTYNWTIEEF